MTYNKEQDILNMYKWKCGYQKTPEDPPCRTKFLDKQSLRLHLQMMHEIIAKDISIPKRDLLVSRALEVTGMAARVVA